jgi:putative endonuclease
MTFPHNQTAAGQLLSKPPRTTKQVGDSAEDLALAHLQQAGLRLVVRNYRMPGRGGCEIDLIMAAPDGTCVFVEVRQRKISSHGGAAASISAVKQRHIVLAAQHYLAHQRHVPPCRFDVVAVDAGAINWLVAAFDAPQAR